MSRYIRGRLERLRERVQPPESPHDSGPRAATIEELDRIAAAKRDGTLSQEEGAELREALRAAAAGRRGEG